MTGHVRITFYVGLARRGDLPSNPTGAQAATADARALALARYFARAYPSGTFTRADGYWQGVAEPSAVFQVVMPDEPATRPHAYDVAARLSVLHKQAGIGVAIDPVVFRVIGPDDLPSVFHGRYARQGETLETVTAEPSPAAVELALNAGALLGDMGTFLESRDADGEEAVGRG